MWKEMNRVARRGKAETRWTAGVEASLDVEGATQAWSVTGMWRWTAGVERHVDGGGGRQAWRSRDGAEAPDPPREDKRATAQDKTIPLVYSPEFKRNGRQWEARRPPPSHLRTEGVQGNTGEVHDGVGQVTSHEARRRTHVPLPYPLPRNGCGRKARDAATPGVYGSEGRDPESRRLDARPGAGRQSPGGEGRPVTGSRNRNLQSHAQGSEASRNRRTFSRDHKGQDDGRGVFGGTPLFQHGSRTPVQDKTPPYLRGSAMAARIGEEPPTCPSASRVRDRSDRERYGENSQACSFKWKEAGRAPPTKRGP
ncbi:hypothetical protein GWK47_012621 [Chionoecetes opilio]|uniref:Uncharacterized protein n=1 Tax=Chionoecetes opilio TaxID=41210 RepID=A0A8J5CLT6_CHIOP|nr:hypothetical protein GWK47_012621 [Chionoecetes opilio]